MSFTIFLVVLTLTMGVILCITPYITRKTECFGVSIPADNSNDEFFRTARHKYVKSNITVTIIDTILVGFLAYNFGETAIWLIVFLFIPMIFSFTSYLATHKKAKLYKTSQPWANKMDYTVSVSVADKVEYKEVSLKWLWLMPILTVVTIIVTAVVYDKIPETFAMNFDYAGNPNGYTEKSVLSVSLMPIVQLFLSVIIYIATISFKMSKKVIDPQNSEQSLKRLYIFRNSWMIFTMVCGILFVALMGLVQFGTFGIIAMTPVIILAFIFTVGIIIAAIVLSFKLGQGGDRIRTSSEKNNSISVRDDDKYWKMGCIYYNPDDPAVFVEKRFGIGTTSNFARPLTWIILVGIVILIVLMVALCFLMV